MYSKVKPLMGKNSYNFLVRLNRSIGWRVSRQAPNDIIEMYKVKISTSFTEYNHMPYFLLTSFPVPWGLTKWLTDI
jgi:hypothetical protein